MSKRARQHKAAAPPVAVQGPAPRPAMPEQDEPSLRRITLVALAGFFVVTVVLYRGIWDNSFYKDDYHWLLVARTIAQAPLKLFSPDELNPEVSLRLTQRLVMAITHGLFGLSPAAHHVASLVLHAVTSTLVFRLLLALHLRFAATTTRSAILFAGFGGLIFAATHNHAMAVLWLAAQSGLLAAGAVTATALYLVRHEESLLRQRTLIGMGLFFLLALYSKNTVVAFPLAIVAFALLAPLGPLDRDRKKAWLLVSGGMLAMSALHLVFTKLILFGGSLSGVSQKAAVSVNVLGNLAGAVLSPFISATDYTRLTGDSIPYPVAAVALAVALLGLSRALNVLRPVAWGLVWILAMALPVSFMNYQQYDPVQLTVTRYYYGPMIGAAIIASFLLRGLATRFAGAAWVPLLAIVLVVGHLGYHGMRMRGELDILLRWGESDHTILSKTVERAEAELLPGTVIYAIGWPTEKPFVRCMGQLYLEPSGFELRVPDDPAAIIAEFRTGQHAEAWAAVFDPTSDRFGTMPLRVYVNWLDQRSQP